MVGLHVHMLKLKESACGNEHASIPRAAVVPGSLEQPRITLHKTNIVLTIGREDYSV